jgi:tetratricopeptide (TPR) repeat protein
MTMDGAMMGTLNYMSPEQLLGLPVDYRSDMFAAGAVAYELLSYQQAFSRTLDNAPRQGRSQEDPVPLAELCANMPAGLESIVMRALARQPEDRFASLEETRIALREVRRSIDPQLELEPVATRLISRASNAPESSSSARKELLERRALQIATHKNAARRSYAAQDLEGAIAACEDALMLDPADREALQLLGELQRAKEQRDRESRDRHDRERMVRQQLVDAELKLSQGDIPGTLGLIQQTLAVDSDNSAALALLSRVEGVGTSANPVASTVLRRDVRVEPSRHTSRVTSVREERPAGGYSRRRIVIAGSITAFIVVAVVATTFWLTRGQPSSDTSQPLATGAGSPAPAPVVVTPETVPAEAAPTAISNADTLLQDRLNRITAAYEQGNLADALRLVDPVLATTDDDRVRRLARSIAQSAIRSMDSAEDTALGQKAQDFSPRSLAAANQLKTRAQQALARNDFVEAGRQALEATKGYERAMGEARAAAVPTSRPSSPDPVSAAAPPTVVNNAPTAPPAPIIPPTVPAVSPAAAPPVASAAPTAPVVTAPSAEDREGPGILQTLTRYQTAHRERSVKALLDVYPSLPRERRQALERSFTRDCRDYDASLGNPQLAMNKNDPTFATVTARATYTCQPKTAQPAQSQSFQEVFMLRKLGDRWLIESSATDTTRPR